MPERMGESHATRAPASAARREAADSRQPARQREAALSDLGATTLEPTGLGETMAALAPRRRAEVVLGLQRAIGNASVQRALAEAPDGPVEQLGDLAGRILEASSGGEAPEAAARAELEASLGADLSGVRVHHDGEADSLARAVDAVAFTSGQDIFFAASAYDPHSERGRRLLAHEVAHTVQQAAGPVPGTPAPGGISLSDPEDTFEQAASSYADGVGSPLPAAGVGSAADAAVQRDGDYPWSGPVVDAASSLLWDIGGAAPGLGSVVNGAGLAIDAGKFAIDTAFGDTKSANRRKNDMVLDAYGMIPGVGTYLGMSQMSTDFAALLGRASGQSAEEAPLFGDVWDKGMNEPDFQPMPPNAGGEGAGPMPYEDEGTGGTGGR